MIDLTFYSQLILNHAIGQMHFERIHPQKISCVKYFTDLSGFQLPYPFYQFAVFFQHNIFQVFIYQNRFGYLFRLSCFVQLEKLKNIVKGLTLDMIQQSLTDLVLLTLLLFVRSVILLVDHVDIVIHCLKKRGMLFQQVHWKFVLFEIFGDYHMKFVAHYLYCFSKLSAYFIIIYIYKKVSFNDFMKFLTRIHVRLLNQIVVCQFKNIPNLSKYRFLCINIQHIINSTYSFYFNLFLIFSKYCHLLYFFTSINQFIDQFLKLRIICHSFTQMIQQESHNEREFCAPGKIAIQTFNMVPSLFKNKKNKHIFSKNKFGSSAESTNSDSSEIKTFQRNIPLNSVENSKVSLEEITKNSINGAIRQILKSNYTKLIEQYEGTDKMFTDKQFPANDQSLGGRWSGKIQWKRLSEFMPEQTFVSGNIQPGDILQGQIGDCYFLSALAALAQQDYRIKNIFPSLQIQKNGIYMARILHRGVLQEVVVDDYIPVNGLNKPVFAKPSGGKQIWVMILEKCWAKLYKSYNAISGGLPHEVLHAFSGAPTMFNSMPRDQQKQNALFEMLYEQQENGAVLCCGTKADRKLERMGLVIGHAYTLLGVYKKPQRMVKIRNPWGQKQWTGAASQSDKQFWKSVSKRDKQILGYSNKNDGIFFMLWQDFVNCFNMVDLCLIDDNASYLCVKSSFKEDQGKLYEFQVSEAGKVFISISQQNLRGYKSEVAKKKGYSKTTLIFTKYNQEKKGYQYAFKRSSQYRLLPDHYMSYENLTPGKYMIYAECDWLTKGTHQATIAAYSSSRILLSESSIDPTQFLYQVFMDHARRNSKKKQMLNTQQTQWMCSQFLTDKCGFGYAAYHLDRSSKGKLGLELDQEQYKKKNMTLLKPYGGNGKIKTVVEPGQELIVLFKMDPYKIADSFTIPLPKVARLVQ